MRVCFLIIPLFVFLLSVQSFAKSENTPESNMKKQAVTATPMKESKPGKNPLSSSGIILPGYGSSLKSSVFADIIDKMKSVNSGLNDYSCPVSVQTKAKYAFLEIPFTISGSYYYKYPNKYRVKFEKAPQFLSRYPQIFGWSLPEPSEYSAKIIEAKEPYKNTFILRLVPKKGRGDLQKIELWVEPDTWLYSRQKYSYKDGGVVDFTCSYRTLNNFSLFDKANIQLSFPKSGIQATAEVTYGTYSINEGIDDSVFN